MDSFIIFGASYLFLIVGLGAAYLFFVLPKEKRLSYVLAGAISGIIALILTKLAGAAYFDPRPFTHGTHALIQHAPDNGFPSDHSVLSFTIALLVFTYNRRLGTVLMALAVLVAVCRVAVGVHTPLDVIAGAGIGLVSAGIGTLIIWKWRPNQ
ncbi:phosphatase PAP2 family protein [Patescibacteria group bacterium]|nr:phosphatase PAP2 family protein [Patescibacteria group bacterium]